MYHALRDDAGGSQCVRSRVQQYSIRIRVSADIMYHALLDRVVVRSLFVRTYQHQICHKKTQQTTTDLPPYSLLLLRIPPSTLPLPPRRCTYPVPSFIFPLNTPSTLPPLLFGGCHCLLQYTAASTNSDHGECPIYHHYDGCSVSCYYHGNEKCSDEDAPAAVVEKTTLRTSIVRVLVRVVLGT